MKAPQNESFQLCSVGKWLATILVHNNRTFLQPDIWLIAEEFVVKEFASFIFSTLDVGGPSLAITSVCIIERQHC